MAGEGNTANEWQQKIVDTWEKGKKDSAEEVAIAFVLAQKNAGMPEERLQKLIGAITKILEQKSHDKEMILKECEEALKWLKNEKGFLEDISSLAEKVTRNIDEKLFDTNKKAEQEIKRKLWLTENISLDDCGFSDNWLHGFSKEKWGNYIVSIQEFEQSLKNTPAEQINSRALANYFKYLRSKGNLSPETLIKNFSGATLASLGKLWASGGNKNEMGANKLIAKTTLINNNMQYVVDIVVKLWTPGKFLEQVQSLHGPNEQRTALLLLKENYNSLQSKFKEEMKARLLAKNPKIKDVDANTLVEKLLSDILQYEGIKWLQEIYKKIDDFSNKYNLWLKTGEIKNITDGGYQVMKAGNKYASAKAVYRAKNETNPQSKKQAEAEVKRLEQKQKEIERAEQVNKKTTNSDVEKLISWEQKIDTVVARMREEDEEFDKEFKAWEKEDREYQRWDSEWRIQEKEWTRKDEEEKTTKIKEASWNISHSWGIYNSLNEGEIRTISLDRSTQSADKISIEKAGDVYTIRTNNLSDKGIQLTTEKVPKYIESLRFMERLGLGYFIQNLPQNELTNIIELTSRNMIRVNNQDGTFDEEEKIALLRGFGNLLGVEKSNNIINSKDGQILFDNHFKIKSTRDVLSSKNIIQNGALNVMALKWALSGNNKQA